MPIFSGIAEGAPGAGAGKGVAGAGVAGAGAGVAGAGAGVAGAGAGVAGTEPLEPPDELPPQATRLNSIKHANNKDTVILIRFIITLSSL